MKSYELFAELASENRLGILHALKEKPLKFTALASKIKATSPEASRQIHRLTSAELIFKDVEGNYSLTSLGELVMSSVSTLEAIAQNAGFFRNHDTSVIPPHLLKKLEALSKGEMIEGVFTLVNRTEMLFEEIGEYAWYLSDNFPLFYLPRVEKKLEASVKFRVIYPRDFMDKLLQELDPKIRHGVEMRMLDEVNMIININDRYGVIALPDPDGNIDRDLTLLGHDEDFKQWCRDVFEYYWEKASPF